MKKKIKVVHIPYSYRNPYQRLLCESLDANGVNTYGEKRSSIKFVDITLFKIFLKYRKPDIIHFHWHHPFFLVRESAVKTILKSLLFLSGVLLLRIAGVKYVWTVHNLTSHEKEHVIIEKWFLRIFAKICHSIIAHCTWAKREIAKNLGKKNLKRISVVPHGNFAGFYPNTIHKQQARISLNLKEHEVVFLFLGEIRYYKGILELIDNFSSLNADNAKLIIAGKPLDNVIATEVMKKTESIKNIDLSLAFVPDEDLHLFINACDVMVFPYRDIFTSGSIILAMSFGKPVIAPLRGCIGETLDGKGGFTYDASKPDGLKNSMYTAIKSRDTLREMGEYNIKCAEKLNWRRIGKDTVKCYRTIFKANK